MEEEVTKVSLNRYKSELDQKQKFLKTSQKYEEQLRDFRVCLALILKLLDISQDEIPTSLKDPKLLITEDTGQFRLDTQTNEEFLKAIASNKDLLKVVKTVESRLAEMESYNCSKPVVAQTGDELQVQHYNHLIHNGLTQNVSRFDQLTRDSDSQWRIEYERLLRAFRSELNLRRSLHNQL